MSYARCEPSSQTSSAALPSCTISALVRAHCPPWPEHQARRAADRSTLVAVKEYPDLRTIFLASLVDKSLRGATAANAIVLSIINGRRASSSTPAPPLLLRRLPPCSQFPGELTNIWIPPYSVPLRLPDAHCRPSPQVLVDGCPPVMVCCLSFGPLQPGASSSPSRVSWFASSADPILD
jgi:hypothetical protein